MGLNKQWFSNEQMPSESRREREFYSYYEAILSLYGSRPKLCDLNDPESASSHVPISSPDKALTAFAQLAALRLRSKRAMMFFFDTSYAYVLAEATRTLSLLDETQHDIEDGLWLGATVIPRGLSVCEVTVNLPANKGSNSTDSGTSGLVHIINDLKSDVRFCDRPFVTGGPLARFYAGVPITTPTGINIGAFCVLDDKPREGLSENEVKFLREMAETTMTHLDMVRAKSENERSHDMTIGIGAFIEGKSSSKDGWVRNSIKKTGNKLQPKGSDGMRSTSTAPRNPLQVGHPGTLPLHPNPPNTGKQIPPEDAALPQSNRLPEPLNRSDAESKVDQLVENPTADKLRNTFTRAASIICKALQVDGVMFLDTSIGTLDEMEVSSSGASDGENDFSADSKKKTERPERSRFTDSVRPDPECGILGSAYDHTSDLSASSFPNLHQNVKRRFLRSLLRRYPHGRVWNFNQDGDASSDENSEDSMSNVAAASETGTSDQDQYSDDLANRKRSKKLARARDGRRIQETFPGVRSLILMGIWDSHGDRWFAGSIIWTYSPIRILSSHFEVNYLAAFCDILLAEVWRIDHQIASKAKSDFISIISHELRSPLHGILGSVEYLHEQQHDALTEEMINSVQSCSTTLLDIINHLLEYSRINNLSRPARRNLTNTLAEPQNLFPELKRTVQNGAVDMRSLVADVSLIALTEEVLETACIGHVHRRFTPSDKQLVESHGTVYSSDRAHSDGLVVTLDVDQIAEVDWFFRVPVGAWRQICMNLFSNALKYTQGGYVRVSLAQQPRAATKHGAAGTNVVLTVSDSGIGISETFQKTRLFKAFQQEDTLSEGTGLGLNITARTVKAQRGTLSVRSGKGAGTVIEVKLPLSFSIPNPLPTILQQSVDSFQDVLVGFVGFSKQDENQSGHDGRQVSCINLHETCARLGMQTYMFDDRVDPNAKMHLIWEDDLRMILDLAANGKSKQDRELLKVLSRPVIIICNLGTSISSMTSSYKATVPNRQVVCISQPITLTKTVKAVTACMSSNTHISEQQGSLQLGNVEPLQQKRSGLDLDENVSEVAPEPQPTIIVSHSQSSTANSSAGVELNDRSPSPVNPEILRNDQKVDSKSPDRISDPVQIFSNITNSEPVAIIEDPNKALQQTSPLAIEGEERKIDERVSQPRPQLKRTSFVSTRGAKQPHTLLLVDDNPINLKLLKLYAKKAAHPCVTAQDGLQAVEAYKMAAEHREDATTPMSDGGGSPTASPVKPRVILMDINMPIMNGFESTREIRKFEREADIEPATIIALTGLGTREAQDEARACGMDLFLTKPVQLKELTRILDSI